MPKARLWSDGEASRLRHWLASGAFNPREVETREGVLTTIGTITPAKDGRGSVIRADLAGRCSRPVSLDWQVREVNDPLSFDLSGRSADAVDVKEGGKFVIGSIHVPCRKCDHCLRSRRSMWRRRAVAETAAAQRTWFGTFTLDPASRAVTIARACVALRKLGLEYDAVSEAERFRAVHAALSSELTLYFKRLRKNTGAKLRYLLVAEAHKDGFPHFHALVHEIKGVCTKREMQEAWHLGFTSFKLVESNAACGYVTKYLAKSMLARVRASLDYGGNCELAYSQLAELPQQKPLLRRPLTQTQKVVENYDPPRTEIKNTILS